MAGDAEPTGMGGRLTSWAVGILLLSIAVDVAVHVLYAARVELIIVALIIAVFMFMRMVDRFRNSRW